MKRAAFAAFGVAGVAGLVLAATTAWWLVAVGLVCVVAAWFYTGGSKPYGYLGLGEVMVFVFFGLVAVVGTTYVQTETWEWPALYAGVGVGALACAILVANNLRDIPTDTVAGKRTLAVRLGDERTRALYCSSCSSPPLPWSPSRSPRPGGRCVGLGFLLRRGPRPAHGAVAARSARPWSRCCSHRPGRAGLGGPGRGRWRSTPGRIAG